MEKYFSVECIQQNSVSMYIKTMHVCKYKADCPVEKNPTLASLVFSSELKV